MQRLSHFIREHRDAILVLWETFARERQPGNSMDVGALRDHAGGMLDAIARDLETPQTEQERLEKSRGLRDALDAAAAAGTAAGQHGLGRAASGYTLESMLAEFRALRASVIHLWREEEGQAGPDELEELTRFNEAIDQAVAVSVAQFTRAIDATRDRFFAVLGHDLRTPLGAIITATQFLLETTQLTDSQRTIVAGMERSGERMTELVRDLLDLALTGLGARIPLTRVEMDMGALVDEVVAEAAASNPGSGVEVERSGSLCGSWDKARLAQALTNLVGNAMQHGSRDRPIRLSVRGDKPQQVTVAITNEGPTIPPARMASLFDAMKGAGDGHDQAHLGLGLYIVDRIVEAHGGRIDVRSSEAEGTTFALCLPRRGDGWEELPSAASARADNFQKT